ncbi:MAG TPA: CRISPR-associated helicase Cas3', partial [Syntrophales bacterium]|nr:CRISPR-associated helicase Cas3' [Syntrophales bacterium]
YEKWPHIIGKTIAYIISGHHAGLPDWFGGRDSLPSRMKQEKDIADKDVRNYAEPFLTALPGKLHPPDFAMRCHNRDAIAYHFWVRMLFSCLVDADFLNTEAFMDNDRHTLRPSFLPLSDLKERFDHKMMAFKPNTPVNRIRAEILIHCRTCAMEQPGLFSLTVPTGGGKTLSAMAFALDHATHLEHKKDRIIYVIPYTSIIEQTAETLRQYFGPENVIEHHSNIMPEKETPSHTLAAENWDAPIIVTTSVQFFESLYAAKPGRCRKLHNIANSVVILDEAQLLPPELLQPCVEGLNRLIADYKVTVVLSTATQPALPNLCCQPREIIPDAASLYIQLKRTNISFPGNITNPTAWSFLATELSEQKQVLCIVNTRKDCYSLWKEMPEDTIHLSALMCGKHRSQIITDIKAKLPRGEKCRVISTQLVEAGVDIDFPVVYRALAGLDSINQAAGRCNREGKRPDLGQVHVFIAPKPSPPGLLRKGEDTTKEMASIPGFVPDMPDTYRKYFERYYAGVNDMGEDWWRKNLVKDVNPDGNVQFRTAGREFRLIKDPSIPIIVRFGDNGKIIDRLRFIGPYRELMRSLQRYTVSIEQSIADRLLAEGRIEEVYDGIFVQADSKLYSPQIGLDIYSGTYEPEDLCI